MNACTKFHLVRTNNYLFFSFTRHPAYILFMNPCFISGWVLVPYFNLVSKICVPKFIRLGQIVFVFYWTGHDEYIAYRSIYCNWLIFKPNQQFGAMKARANFIRFGQVIFELSCFLTNYASRLYYRSNKKKL